MSSILDTICFLDQNVHLAPFMSQSPYAFCGRPSPKLAEGVSLGDWAWYTVKVFHIRHSLSAGTETLSFSFMSQSPDAVSGVTAVELGRGCVCVAL